MRHLWHLKGRWMLLRNLFSSICEINHLHLQNFRDRMAALWLLFLFRLFLTLLWKFHLRSWHPQHRFPISKNIPIPTSTISFNWDNFPLFSRTFTSFSSRSLALAFSTFFFFASTLRLWNPVSKRLSLFTSHKVMTSLWVVFHLFNLSFPLWFSLFFFSFLYADKIYDTVSHLFRDKCQACQNCWRKVCFLIKKLMLIP